MILVLHDLLENSPLGTQCIIFEFRLTKENPQSKLWNTIQLQDFESVNGDDVLNAFTKWAVFSQINTLIVNLYASAVNNRVLKSFRYVTCGCRILKLILKSFGPVIKSNVSIPLTPGGVDLMREERFV